MRFTLLALAAATVVPTPTIAAPLSTTVVVTPADFTSPTARARLDRRIGAAIEDVCGSYATIEAYQWPEMDACWKAARNQVTERLGNISKSTKLAFESR